MVSRRETRLRAVIEKLDDCGKLDLDDALALAHSSIRSLSSLLREQHPSSEGKLESLAATLARLKSEIIRLEANHLRRRHIPEAGRELEATITATEAAATRILEAAETILAADPADTDAYLETVRGEVMTIFEACAFQDITGQRLAKARENLDSIALRVDRFADAVGVSDTRSGGAACPEEARREQRKAELMLNGPAADGEARNQAEIDALLSG